MAQTGLLSFGDCSDALMFIPLLITDTNRKNLSRFGLCLERCAENHSYFFIGLCGLGVFQGRYSI